MPSRQAALSRPRQEQLHHGQEPLTLDSLDALLFVSQVETASSVHGQSWIMMAVRPVSGAPPSRSPRRRTRTFPLFCRATTPRSSCCELAAASALCGPCCSFGLVTLSIRAYLVVLSSRSPSFHAACAPRSPPCGLQRTKHS